MNNPSKLKLSYLVLILGTGSFVGLFFSNIIIELLFGISTVILTIIANKDRNKNITMISIGTTIGTVRLNTYLIQSR